MNDHMFQWFLASGTWSDAAFQVRHILQPYIFEPEEWTCCPFKCRTFQDTPPSLDQQTCATPWRRDLLPEKTQADIQQHIAESDLYLRVLVTFQEGRKSVR